MAFIAPLIFQSFTFHAGIAAFNALVSVVSLPTQLDTFTCRRGIVFKQIGQDLVDHNHQKRLGDPIFLKPYGVVKPGNFKFEDSGYEYSPQGQDEVTLFDLVGAFRKMLEKRNKKLVVHRVDEVNVTIEDRIDYIMGKLSKVNEIIFSKLFDPKDPKIVWIVTFIALLEMTKNKMVRPVQANAFDEITLVKVNG